VQAFDEAAKRYLSGAGGNSKRRRATIRGVCLEICSAGRMSADAFQRALEMDPSAFGEAGLGICFLHGGGRRMPLDASSVLKAKANWIPRLRTALALHLGGKLPRPTRSIAKLLVAQREFRRLLGNLVAAGNRAQGHAAVKVFRAILQLLPASGRGA